MKAVRLQPLVALTVDAEHPDRRRCAPGNCERILEAPDEAGIRATFPVQHAATPTAPTPGGRAVDTPYSWPGPGSGPLSSEKMA